MDINSAALDIDTSGAITIDAAGAASHIAITTAHTAGDAVHIDANANAGSIVNIDAGILDIDSDGVTTINAASTVHIGGATGATFGDDTEALAYDGSGNLDLDAVALDMDMTADSSINVNNTNSSLSLGVGGGGSQELTLLSAGTGANALRFQATAGGLDIDTAGAVAIDSTGLSIDNAGVAANITSTTDGAAEDFTIALAGATDSSLILSSTGTGADALQLIASAGGIDITASGGAGEDVDISSVGSVTIFSEETVADAIKLSTGAGSIDIDSADNITIDAVDNIIITTTSTDGNISLVSADSNGGVAVHIDANANADSIVDIDAGVLDIDVIAGATIDAVGIALGAGSGELDLTTTGTMDINSGALDIDTSGAIAIDAAGAASDIKITTAHTAGVAFHLDANANAGSEVQIDAGVLDIDVTAAATIDAVGIALGAGSGELDLTTTGTMDMNAETFDIDGGGGGFSITAAAPITIDAIDTSSHIAITTAHTAGVAFHLDANANAGSEVQIDAGILDIDVTGEATLDAGAGYKITAGADSFLKTDSSGADMSISAAGGGTQKMTMASAGTGLDALVLNASAGSIDIDAAVRITMDAADNIALTTSTADGLIFLHSAHTAGVAMHLDANANVDSVLDIDAGTLDIDIQAAATLDAVGIALGAGSGQLDLTTTGLMDINSAALDIDASGAINIAAAGGASDISISTAHTAGVAFHLDANANAGSIVDIDAGVLDIDVTGVTTIDTERLTVTGATILSSLVDLTPTLVVTDTGITLAAGREYVIQDADGGALVLPAASIGARINIVIATLISSNTITITAATGDLLKGYAFLEATDAANNKTYFAPDGSDDLIITLNGSTKGGLIGDRIELVGISATEWRVRATLSHTSTAANPFS